MFHGTLRKIALCLIVPCCAAATADEPLVIHSDLPFRSRAWQNVSPHSCGDEMRVVGICAPFKTGRWSATLRNCQSACERFIDLSLQYHDYYYGFRQSQDERDADGSYQPALIFELTRDSERVAIYAIEIGHETGSRYLLVSRAQGGKDPIGKVDVLDLRCEGKGTTWRRLPTEDELPNKGKDWRELPDEDETAYCSVASLDDLERMAREALRRSPSATMEYVGPEERDDPRHH